jgi:hypothetical protein
LPEVVGQLATVIQLDKQHVEFSLIQIRARPPKGASRTGDGRPG